MHVRVTLIRLSKSRFAIRCNINGSVAVHKPRNQAGMSGFIDRTGLGTMSSSLPDYIAGYGPVRPFAGAFAHLGEASRVAVRVQSIRPDAAKVLPSIRSAIQACGLKDGA